MMNLMSFPLFLSAGISLLLGSFYSFLFFRIKFRHSKHVATYSTYSLIALVYGLFLASFGAMLNLSDNLPLMSIFNRLAVFTASFTAPATLLFFRVFFQNKQRWDVWVLTILGALMGSPAFFEWDVYLITQLNPSEAVYAGLQIGPLFMAWGVYINAVLFYTMIFLVKVLVKKSKEKEVRLRNHALFFMISGFLWVSFGILDALTAIRILNIIPLSWIGALSMLLSMAGALISEIEDLYENINKLYNEVIHDKLTGTYSRNFLEVRLRDLFENFRRHEGSFYLGIFDLDEFKAINDNHGHLVGDMVLKGITETLRTCLRPTDILARMGGDEFIFIIEQVKEDDLQTILRRIMKRIGQLEFFPSQNENIKATCSFGLSKASHPEILGGLTFEQLIDRADRALYESKRSGRNQISFFQPQGIKPFIL